MQKTPKDWIDLYIESRNNPASESINSIMRPRFISYDEEKKSVRFGFLVRKWQLNDLHNLHGGLIATAVDSTMGSLPYIFANGHEGPTIQMSINYVLPIDEGEELQVEAVVDHMGRRVTQTHCTAYNARTGRVIATAHASFLASGRTED